MKNKLSRLTEEELSKKYNIIKILSLLLIIAIVTVFYLNYPSELPRNNSNNRILLKWYIIPSLISLSMVFTFLSQFLPLRKEMKKRGLL